MPYQCAKHICATFCHNIAGALIPIFGPDFPSICTPSEAPEYSRMIIDPAIVIQSTREAEHFRRVYGNSVTSSAGGRVSPMRDRRPLFRPPYDDPKHLNHHHRRPPMRKTFVNHAGYDSPYATDTDSDLSPVVAERGSMGTRDRFLYAPVPSSPAASSLRPTSSGWTPANMVLPHHYDTPGPSPWLSAVPRFTTTAHQPPYHPPQQHHHTQSQSQSQSWRGGKRPAEQVEADDYGYGGDRRRGGEHRWAGATESKVSVQMTTPREDSCSNSKPPGDAAILGADKNAALLLMNLSVRDSRGTKSGVAGAVASETNSPRDGAFPRIKRVRANSM